jgi:N-methylhydantoinase B
MPAEGVTIKATVQVDPHDARIEIDLRDNPDCLPCGLNLSEATARTAAMIGIFNSLDHTVPKNAGSFRRLNILLRVGCVVGIPQHPTSCSVATTNMADRVASAVQSAIADMSGNAGLAECGAVQAPAMSVISGVDPRSGQRFINQVFLGFSGGAAGPEADAWQTICHVGNAGLCFLDSIELDEMRQPLLVRTRSFVADSEGAGKHNGARSMFVEFGPLGCDIEVGYVSDGSINGPKGVRGGLPGATSKQFKRLTDGAVAELPGASILHLSAGETVLSYSCGGGGYGRPETRDSELVRSDVAEGYLSLERARSVYGVVLDAAGQVDSAKTTALRATALEKSSTHVGAGQ